jgi:hypothetical protein
MKPINLKADIQLGHAFANVKLETNGSQGGAASKGAFCKFELTLPGGYFEANVQRRGDDHVLFINAVADSESELIAKLALSFINAVTQSGGGADVWTKEEDFKWLD